VGVKSRRDDTRLIKHQQVTWIQVIPDVSENPMGHPASLSVKDEQA
jgi:hypothetical protein